MELALKENRKEHPDTHTLQSRVKTDYTELQLEEKMEYLLYKTAHSDLYFEIFMFIS